MRILLIIIAFLLLSILGQLSEISGNVRGMRIDLVYKGCDHE